MDAAASASAELLGAEGPFRRHLPGFAPRGEQLRLAAAIEDALAAGATLVAEAGTGIGKTLAYLVPALLDGGRVIVSTGTKTLQDQLFFRDLPLVREALGSDAEVALLKGRANYLCLYRMKRTREEGRLPSREAVATLEALRAWSTRTEDGDLSNATVLAEDTALWPMVTSTTDNCLGSDCPDYEDCFVARARRRAQSADVVVVNHHLLFADMAVKRSGFGEVLPGAAAFIVDEAHQAPEIATQFFSQSFSARQVTDLCRDLLAEAGEVTGGLGSLRAPVQACQDRLAALQAAVAEHLPERGAWRDVLASAAVRDALAALDEALIDLGPAVAGLEGASRGLDACIARRAEIEARLDRLDDGEVADEVRWFERRGRGFALHMTPLDIADVFRGFREALDAAWVFTSATLAVRGDFGHFTGAMGLDDAETLCLDSPFDYPNHALAYLPPGLPEPRTPGYTRAVVDLATDLVDASGGRAFLLFTSHRALREAAELLAGRLDYPLLVQGEQPRSVLLETFRTAGDAVLLGTSSFWEGVDVIGDALSLVVIDKLPFSAPDDPVMEARSQALRRDGGNPFMDLFLPRAVIALKQGAGRLIRDVGDRGVLVLCDPRLRTRGYGEVFLDSLPPMRRTDDAAEARAFLAP